MKTILCAAACLFAVATTNSSAEMRYDRKLEKAVMNIVAGKIGDIRGGFSYKLSPKMVIVRSHALPLVRPSANPQDEADGIVTSEAEPTNKRGSSSFAY